MAYKVEKSPVFEKRFFDVLDYLVLVERKTAASKFVDSLERSGALLGALPYHGATVRKYKNRPPSDALRWIPVDDYAVVYRVYEEPQKVVLEDLFYNGSNWKSFLSKCR